MNAITQFVLECALFIVIVWSVVALPVGAAYTVRAVHVGEYTRSAVALTVMVATTATLLVLCNALARLGGVR